MSVGGKSYFVNPLLAQELGSLPTAQRWERLQRMGSQRHMEDQQDMKEISIDGKSYFVNPLLAQEVGGLPAAQQWERMQRKMGPSSYEDTDKTEISVGGQSYFVNPLLAQELGSLPTAQRWERLQRMGSQRQMEEQQDMKEISIDGKSYFINPLLAQEVGGLPAAQQWERMQRMGSQRQMDMQSLPQAQQWERIQRMGLGAGPRIVRSWDVPTQNVYNQEFNQQRVVRTPISKTVTVLPNEVTRVTRNIKTHMPMVHERIRHHYNVENVNRKNVIHHYVEPIQDKRLGTRTGRSSRLGTEHVMYRNRMYNPLSFATEQGEMNMNGAVSNGNFWQVQQAQSCSGLAAGQAVRPQAICLCNGQVCDNNNCSDLPYPEDIMC